MSQNEVNPITIPGMTNLIAALNWSEVDESGQKLLCEEAADVYDALCGQLNNAVLRHNQALMELYGKHLNEFNDVLASLRRRFGYMVLKAFDQYVQADEG